MANIKFYFEKTLNCIKIIKVKYIEMDGKKQPIHGFCEKKTTNLCCSNIQTRANKN